MPFDWSLVVLAGPCAYRGRGAHCGKGKAASVPGCPERVAPHGECRYGDGSALGQHLQPALEISSTAN